MSQEFIISYDLGTSGIKVVLVSTLGEVLGTATYMYPLYQEHDGWAEQDPELYWAGVCKGTREVLARCGFDPADAVGIAFSTQWKGVIPVDKKGRVLHNSIIWLDSRAGDQARRLNEHFGKEMFFAADYWPRLMWFRENCPDLYEQAETIFEANSYLKWKATGEAAMDITNSFVRSPDPEIQAVYDKILSFAGLSLDKFPPCVPVTQQVGRVTEKAAAEMGLVPGIPVFAGCGDIPAMAIGSGTAKPGGAHIYFGTSGWIAYCVPHIFNGLYVSPLDEQRDVRLCGLNAIGIALNWAVERFYPAEFARLGDGVFEIVNRELAEVPVGCDGVLAAPWFYGEMPPIGADGRGTFFNLGSQHKRQHLTRAVMEGLCFTLKMNNIRFREEQGFAAPTEYSAIGGGSLSPVWMQMLADVMNTPINVLKNTKHTGAIGTAYCALVGLGLCKDFTEVADRIFVAHRYEPNPETVAVYQYVYERFIRLFEAICPLFGKQ
jgi:xylulokinase